jgi:predicted HTH transcriptional regulator
LAKKKEFLSGISAPRNKEIMRIFKDLKLVEHLGSGVKRILEKYDESVFDITPNFMRVTFKFEEESVGVNVGVNVGVKDIKLNKNQKKTINEITKNSQVTQSELALLLNVTDRTIQRNATILQRKGLLKRIGSDKSGHWDIIK